LAASLGPLLCLSSLVLSDFNSSQNILVISRLLSIGTGLPVYFESTAYFALAIQVAAITVLGPKDFEADNTSFGDLEARTAGFACIICLLPLLYPFWMLSDHAVLARTQQQHFTLSARQPHRMWLLPLTALASVYPFISQATRMFSPSQVGNELVSQSEWRAVVGVCFGPDVALPSIAEQTVFAACQLASSLIVYIFVIRALVPEAVRKLETLGSRTGQVRENVRHVYNTVGKICRGRAARYVLLLFPYS